MINKPTVAVIGSGISGMASAYLLNARFDVTLFEKNPITGGHTRTKSVRFGDVEIPVDTGFIVFNPVNYPELMGLFRVLDVPRHESNMSFAFTMNNGGFEWGARNLNAVFGQRSNVLRPSFYLLIRDVLRFFRQAEAAVATQPELTLGDLLQALRLGPRFRDRFILPMGAAIWSCPAETMLAFPARTFVQFFRNHGLLSLDGQHQWYTVTGGSREYMRRILAPLDGRIRTGSPVVKVGKAGDKILLEIQDGAQQLFDHVVFASHADETLAMLKDATPEERAILGAFQYQANRAYLHSDIAVMPKRRACWASWNYSAHEGDNVAVTYWMNLLQGIDNRYPLFVTLNPDRPIDPAKVHDEHLFHHPVFTREAIAAQARIPEIQGKRNLWFCGAYQRYGFHEDGLMSAVAVAKAMGAEIPWH